MIKEMLVDDSSVMLSIIEEIINTEVIFDIELLPFLEPTLAKEQFLNILPDFVITDIEMPHFDGLQFIEFIKSVSTTPILAMSGSSIKNNSTDMILHCAKLSGAEYIISKDEVAENISQLISEIITMHCLE